jgi:hypothetical protein
MLGCQDFLKYSFPRSSVGTQFRDAPASQKR